MIIKNRKIVLKAKICWKIELLILNICIKLDIIKCILPIFVKQNINLREYANN